MDPVEFSQYQTWKDSFARAGTNIEAAYTPAGEIDYMYVVGRLLARAGSVGALQVAMPEVDLAGSNEQPRSGDLVLLSIDGVAIDRGAAGSLTVPETLDYIDERLPNNPGLADGVPLWTPQFIMRVAKSCSAGEPEVPCGNPTDPCPPPNPAGGGQGVKVGICDTGLQPNATAAHAWLANVAGDPEPLGPILPSGLQRIPKHAGHGTFAAGVAACTSPGADVYVSDHFTLSGAEKEDVIVDKIEDLILNQAPDVICLPAGTYTRNNWVSLGFDTFNTQHPDIPLVVSAGNDTTDKEFYPAAFPWAIAVGALGPDQQHRAWFSNYGNWVDVYALGEGMVNAFVTGEYTYQEPPKQPAEQTFSGMARCGGTSFSAPLVAGLIANEMAQSGSTAAVAAQAVLAQAQAQAIPGVGPALFPP
jgi:Subtilase family